MIEILENRRDPVQRNVVYRCRCKICGRVFMRPVSEHDLAVAEYPLEPVLRPHRTCLINAMDLFYRILEIINRCFVETNDASATRFRLLELD